MEMAAEAVEPDLREVVKMPYVTSVERVGIKIGEEIGKKIGEKRGIVRRSREAVLEILKTRFGRIPTSLTSAVNAIEDPANLKSLLKQAVTTPSIEDFQKTLKDRS
jgi:hypothetical protein